MSELKPCPFCGGEAFVNDDPTGNGGKPHMSGNVGLGRLWSVECYECGADAGFWQDSNVAIKAWNTRADDYKQAAEYWQRMYEQAFAERTCHNTQSDFDFMCSNCGKMLDNGRVIGVNYCPNCGAKVVSE